MALTPSTDQEDSSHLKLVFFSNEFPNDDLQDMFRKIHVRSKDNRHPILRRFLAEATLATQEEVKNLPLDLRNLVPSFQSVLNLIDYPVLRKGPLSGSIDGVLLCVLEIASFIGHFEASEVEFDFNPINTSLAGLGIGLLATAAVSLSTTLSAIPTAGKEVVRVAFKLGVLVDSVSQNLQPRDETDLEALDSWAYVLPEVNAAEVQTELDAIHLKDNTPSASRIFVSAISRTSVTVSGPPARLKSLFLLSDFFRDRRYFQLPVYAGLCHASHIYDLDHAREITDTGSVQRLTKTAVPSIPILSTSTGQPFQAKTASELFENIVFEILTQQIEWDNVIDGALQKGRDFEISSFDVLVFRTSLPIHDLINTLKSELLDVSVKTEDLLPWITKAIKDESPISPAQSKIAIVGMACRLPGGSTDTEKFWELLENGLDVHRRIPADRFDVDTHYDPTGKRVNASHTQYGCFIDEPGLFDAPFFNMSPREAEQTDPMQRLALVTAYEALERAGYVANRTAATNLKRIGTFYGQASDDYREVNTAQSISTYFISGGCRAFGPGRINYFFKFGGPSFSIDTACSSSLATIQAACTSLWNNEADTIVAGGMNILTNSDAFAGLSHGHFLSKTPNSCKTWDSEADGYCRADGIGSIVLKRYEDAVADNDNILASILGAGTNHSANAISITHPHSGDQSYLSRQILNDAGVDPNHVSFVEMHGTGTQAGDTVEIQTIKNVYASLTKRRSAKQPLYIGAVKSNVGHGEAVAGVTALIKVLLMFQKETIPKHVGIKNSINPAFSKDLDKHNLNIPFENVPWPRSKSQKRLAVVNNFSAAGGNSTIILEEAPVRELIQTDPRTAHAVAVSAKSKVSLRGNLERLINYLERNPEVSLSDLAYTTTARKCQHNHRVTVYASEVAHLKQQLEKSLAAVDSHKPIPTSGAPPIAFSFTGQGASHKSMNLELFHDSPYFRSQILRLDSIARGQGFPSFIPAIDGSHPKDHFHSPVVTQLALVCTEIALAKYWGSLGVKPDVVIGHSLGEYAALNAAGVLSSSDAVFLVGKRAALLEKKCQIGSHKMLAVRAAMEQIVETVKTLPYEIACINGPKEIVLSGEVAQIEAVAKALEAAGFKTFTLEVAFAFHSAQTDPILDEFEEIASSGVLFQAPLLPIISPLLGKVIFDDKTANANYVRRATREPVDFVSALAAAKRISTVDETTVWVEIGPHPVSIGFVKSNLQSVALAIPSMRRDEDNWTTVTKGIAALHDVAVEVAWNEFHRPFEGALTLLDLPTYSWNDKNHWIQYNGDWALTKGNTFYDAEKKLTTIQPNLPKVSDLQTSTVQQVIKESFNGTAGEVVMQSDLMHPELLRAAHGHQMNGCGVVTSSIHADIAYTLGQYLHKKLKPSVKDININVANLEVLKGLVANKNTKSTQPFQVSISTTDINSGIADLKWSNVNLDGTVEEPFASANIEYGTSATWLESWIPLTHLINGRIEALERTAEQGIANRFTKTMVYRLFSNLVDYADKYQGMQSVVLQDLEAFADIQLTKEKDGSYTVPPFFIDSVAHLAGFIMNASDAIDVKKDFCVTPGWDSMRFARPLVAGQKYRSYVKMIPTTEDPSVYLGDVYILQDGVVIGLVGGIKFRRYPRVLLNRFFSPPDESGHVSTSSSKPKSEPASSHVPAASKPTPAAVSTPASVPPATAISAPPKVETEISVAPAPIESSEAINPDSTAAKAVALVANEAGLDISDLTDDASFASLGVDSLMSLVIAERFREDLGVTVGGSLFLEYPTIGDLRSWLLEYYD